MTRKIAAALAVTLLPACGAAASNAPEAPGRPVGFQISAAELQADEPPRNPDDDYVVGPFVAGEAGVRTYYIVRN
ncbi:MAG TPA: hypothetical protein VFZ53_01255 [Polyangiaceae bacterium]